MTSDHTVHGTATTLAPMGDVVGNGNGNGGNPRPSPVTRKRAADKELQGLVHRMLELLQEDPSREGLRDTPARVQKSLMWLTQGYSLTAEEAVGGAIFEEDHGSLVIVKDIEFYSLCEHHMLPFFGRAHIGYVPSGRVLGLSKIARLMDVFARRLQVQERLTDQVASALESVLEPAGVGVVVEAHHLCMMMRGVQKQNASTVTSAVRGSLATDPGARAEFLRLATGGG